MKDLISHIEKFDDIVRKLAAFDLVLGEDMLGLLLTRSLPKEFANAVLHGMPWRRRSCIVI